MTALQLILSILKGVFIGIAVCLPIVLIFYWLYRFGERQAWQEAEYEKLYDAIQEMIDDYPVNEHNYSYILSHLEDLGQLKYKDRERTHVLTGQFFIKFASEARKKVEEIIEK